MKTTFTKNYSSLFILVLTFLIVSLAWGAEPLDCKAHISNIICEVEAPETEAERFDVGRKCLSVNTDRHRDQIVKAYLLYPEFIQRQFCSLKKIYIEREYTEPSWSKAVDENTPRQIIIGIKKSDLDRGMSLQDFNSWYEQQTFGGSNTELKSGLPTVKVSPADMSQQPYVVFRLLHELAHSFDYQYRYNRAKDDQGFKDSWTTIYWDEVNTLKPKHNFSYRNQICLLNCNSKYITASKANTVYQQIQKSGFVSLASTVDAKEDFAESFTYYVMKKYMKTSFVIEANKKSFPVDKVLNGKKFKDKKIYLDQIIKNLETVAEIKQKD